MLFIFNMRYHCVFKSCNCNKFKQHCNNLCFYCNHANIWHSKKEKPPNDEYLAFFSTREFARKPIYKKEYFQVAIFVPTVPELPETDEDIPYCEAYEILPV